MGNNKNQLSRRDFIRLSAVGAGAALLPLQFATPTATSLAKPAAARKGTLRFGWRAVKKVDPAFVSGESEVAFGYTIYEYLINPTIKGGLEPRLAESWSLSSDKLQYTIKLVKGVKFHNGKALTGADVVWTFNRLRSKDVGSPAAALFANVTDIKATDDTTVVLTLAKTQPDFPYNLADTHAFILQEGTKDPNTTFIGTGPFKLDKFIPEDRAVFVANENYWIPDLPRVAGIEHIYGDTNAQVDALLGGQLDFVEGIPVTRFQSLKDNPDLQTAVYTASGHDLLRIRVDQKPGNDPKVVKALKLATDRKAIFEAVQLAIGAPGRDAPIGPFFEAYFDPNSPLPPYDPEGAKKLLSEAGYPNGLEFDLHVPNSGGRPDFATVIKDQWAKAGIKVNIKIEDESVYYADNGWLEVPLGITGWASRPTPQQYLDFSLRSGGKWNESHVADPELDKQIDLAGSSTDQETRVKAYKEVQRILAERGPIIVPYFFALAGVTSKRVNFEKGYQPFGGRQDLRYVSIKE